MRLQTGADYTQRVPLDLCGGIMYRMQPLFAGSLRMAIEGASATPGRPPAWLSRASDIRFVDYSHDGDDTLIALRFPQLADAAEELYRQAELWDTRPDPGDTAFETFRHVVDDVSAANNESSRYDRQLLTHLAHMKPVFDNRLQAIRLSEDGQKGGNPTQVTPQVTETAACLNSTTPASRQIRILGVLDMIRHSTRGFSLRLESGEEVYGVMENPDALATLPEFFNRAVLVHGRAVYRPSGRLLRIDAAGIEDGAGASPLFAKVPPSQLSRPQATARLKLSETGKRGVSAFFGTWPGTETDADMNALVRDVRGSLDLVH